MTSAAQGAWLRTTGRAPSLVAHPIHRQNPYWAPRPVLLVWPCSISSRWLCTTLPVPRSRSAVPGCFAGRAPCHQRTAISCIFSILFLFLSGVVAGSECIARGGPNKRDFCLLDPAAAFSYLIAVQLRRAEFRLFISAQIFEFFLTWSKVEWV